MLCILPSHTGQPLFLRQALLRRGQFALLLVFHVDVIYNACLVHQRPVPISLCRYRDIPPSPLPHGFYSVCTSPKSRFPLNEKVIKSEIKELVRKSVEETLNGLLEAEVQKLTQAARYEHSEERQIYCSGYYQRNLPPLPMA